MILSRPSFGISEPMLDEDSFLICCNIAIRADTNPSLWESTEVLLRYKFLKWEFVTSPS
jgi:hypothetical protein